MALRNYCSALAFCGFILRTAISICTAAPDAKQGDAPSLVEAASKAEIEGNNARSFALLREATQHDPTNALARWALGEVQIDNKWVPVEEAQHRAAADPLQREYGERRKAAADNPQAQLLLARWCRKNKLNDEAQFHWANVLTVDPTNKEALAALDLQWQKGRLVPRGQNAEEKEQLLKAKRNAEKWAPKLVHWRRAVSSSDANARATALDEIRAIDDAAAIPSIETVSLGRDARDSRRAGECTAIALAFTDALGKMPGQAATESLARHAVFASDEKVRDSATKKLKPRDQHEYVPMLLAGLGMPVESSYNIMTGPDGSVHYYQSLYREGPNFDGQWESSRQAVQRDLGGKQANLDLFTGRVDNSRPSESPLAVTTKKAEVAARYQNRYQMTAATTERRVANANRAIETLNQRIVPVLTATTGQSLGDDPKAWWTWWRDENEYYTSNHPVNRGYDTQVDQYTYGLPSSRLTSSAPSLAVPRGSGRSCFAKGTPVWTKIGLRPIDEIEAGDLVLSQNVDTGELKYQPVLRRTVRPPSQLVKISVDGEELHSTPGHPFWVPGSGWQMAKRLADSTNIHGLTGSVRVRSVSPAETGEAFNLVVADFSTYFVGAGGILAHDVTPHRPTQSAMPGIPKQQPNDAAIASQR